MMSHAKTTKKLKKKKKGREKRRKETVSLYHSGLWRYGDFFLMEYQS